MPLVAHTGELERLLGVKVKSQTTTCRGRMGKVCNLTIRTIISAASVVFPAAESKARLDFLDTTGDQDLLVSLT
jgi:hypothetical protein